VVDQSQSGTKPVALYGGEKTRHFLARKNRGGGGD
jgi:hypothetical protein